MGSAECWTQSRLPLSPDRFAQSAKRFCIKKKTSIQEVSEPKNEKNPMPQQQTAPDLRGARASGKC